MNSFTRTRSVQSLVKDINKNKISVDFSIQRKADQWDRKKKSLLIMSTIQNILIPGIFVEEHLKNWLVLDGKQRLTTLLQFLNDDFALDKNYDEEYANKKFSELDEDTQDKIKNAEIIVYVYQDVSEGEREDIFFRLNNGQPLTASNIFRAIEGPEIRAFIDEAKQKPFITEKVNFTKGQLKKSFDEMILLQSLILVFGNSVKDFSKKAIQEWIKDFRASFNDEEKEAIEKTLKTLDLLDEIIPHKYKSLKPISIPMLVDTATMCLIDKKAKAKFSKNLLEFLEDYENREEYLQYCRTSTSSATNMTGRMCYFNNMLK